MRYLIVLFVVGLVGCVSKKEGLFLPPKDQKGYSDLFQFFAARSREAAADYEMTKVDRESKGERGGELIPEGYTLKMIEFYRAMSELNQKLSSDIESNIRLELATLKNQLSQIRKMILPFTFYVKLTEIEHKITEIDFDMIENELQLDALIRLNLLLLDFSLRRKVDCTKELFKYSNTGMVLKGHPYPDSVCFYHSSLTLMDMDLEINYYDRTGKLLLSEEFDEVDSIKLSISENYALCEIIYTNSNNFHDYIKLDDISDKVLVQIRNQKYWELDLDKWMENQIDEALSGTRGYRYLNFDQLYEIRDSIRFEAGSNYSIDDLKKTINRIYQIRTHNKNYGKDLFGPKQVIPNDHVNFRDYILKFEKEAALFNDYSYFILLNTAMYQFWVYNTFCTNWWGPSSTDRVGVYKRISDEEILYYTSALLVFQHIHGTKNYAASNWKQSFDSIPFPIPGYFRRLDGSMKPVDTIYRENLLQFSTNISL